MIADARRQLDFARRQLGYARGMQDPDRHFDGVPECPRVIALADVVEIWETAIATLERRVRLANPPPTPVPRVIREAA